MHEAEVVHACGLRTKCITAYHDESNYWNKINNFIFWCSNSWNTLINDFFSRKEAFEQLVELFEN